MPRNSESFIGFPSTSSPEISGGRLADGERPEVGQLAIGDVGEVFRLHDLADEVANVAVLGLDPIEDRLGLAPDRRGVGVRSCSM